ncbi:MAG TPA: hypothetical protein VGF26_18500, partial [Ramlibacter sp.]
MDDGIALRVFDPASATDEDWGAFHAFRRERFTEDYPGRPVTPDEAAERELKAVDPLWHTRSVVA